MTTQQTTHPTLTAATRRMNSPSGNPRWDITLDGINRFTTKADIADAYGVSSLVGEQVEFTTENGQIVNIWKAGTR